jgi:hypothetical protein
VFFGASGSSIIIAKLLVFSGKLLISSLGIRLLQSQVNLLHKNALFLKSVEVICNIQISAYFNDTIITTNERINKRTHSHIINNTIFFIILN